ncbi:MAG: helicase-related protein [Hyphomicrobiaceae bacterium]
MSLQSRIRNVTAVLGPTNTGKTHLAIERMLGHQTGMIGLPLRLLAREVYDKVVTRVGADKVALITGEEKIKPEGARYWVSTVEAMPREIDTEFLAIDEIQLAADPDRGHVFTDRLLHARGREETLLLGAATMREAIGDLIPGANFISRPRLSKITYSGQKKITRLPKRTAIVVFSAAEVYTIAELIRRQLGGAAVVLGALSPRTRNAQVALYQSGDVDYIVATDAIGMGLNLDIDHVAFAGVRKFDGQNNRNLTAAELGQVAGRAGRYMNDGTFGVTGDVEPFDADLIERLENHTFETVRTLQWRNRNLDFGSLDRLRESLRQIPGEVRLQRARMADDVSALEAVSSVAEIAELVTSRDEVEKLWDVCQVPDYRKISTQNHAELVATLYGFLMSPGARIPEDWFAKQVAQADRTDGDIDTLATRLAHIRTWTFVSNRTAWLADPEGWQAKTRSIEDSLSDALHEQLAQRFVDRKTSALMKGLRDKDELATEIGSDGAIRVENHFVGRLKGFRFFPDAEADAQGVHGKTARNAAAQVLAKELGMRSRRVASARNDAFKLGRGMRILWRDEEVGQLAAGDDPLKPAVQVLADEHLSGPDREKVQARLETWVTESIAERLKPLVELKAAEDVSGLAKGIAFRMVENFGILKRDTVNDEIRQLDQPSRGQLRKYGVRFGAFNIYLPLLLKPAAAELTLALWAMKNAAAAGLSAEALPAPPRAGLTSVPSEETVPETYYRAAGYHQCGPRAIRIDILERLADQIRPLLAWRAKDKGEMPPKGSSGDGGFIVTPEMMSILGCSADELGLVLKALGFRLDKKEMAVPVTKSAPGKGAKSATVAAPATTPDAANPEAATSATPDDGELAATIPVEPPAAAPAPEPAPPPDSVSPADAAIAAAVALASGNGQDAEMPAAGPAVEMRMIDVWRPRRRDRPERRDAAETEADGENRRGRGDRNRNQNRYRRPEGAPRPGAPADATTTTATTAAAPTEAGATPRTDGAGEGQRPARRADQRPDQRSDNRGQRREDRGPRPAPQGRREGGDRGDRRDDRRRDNDRNRPETRSAAPPRASKGPDPDSPFAKLLALRQQLEKQAKEKSS